MLRIPSVSLLCVTLSLPAAALAQSAPDATASDANAPTWVSDQATDPTGTRTCSVYAVRQGPFPMIFFYGSEKEADLSIEGLHRTPMKLTLQVDANPALDGGVMAMSQKNTAALIKQIRANGRNLRLSHSLLIEGKFEKFDLDLPLAGAVEQLDKCRAWLAR